MDFLLEQPTLNDQTSTEFWGLNVEYTKIINIRAYVDESFLFKTFVYESRKEKRIRIVISLDTMGK